MNAVIGEQITPGVTTAVAITITDDGTTQEVNHFIKVIAGTIKFGRGSVHANAHGFTSTDTVPPIKCRAGELFVKCASITDKLVIFTTR